MNECQKQRDVIRGVLQTAWGLGETHHHPLRHRDALTPLFLVWGCDIGVRLKVRHVQGFFGFVAELLRR